MIVFSYVLIVISSILVTITVYINKVLIGVNFYELVYYFANDKSGYGNNTVILSGIKNSLPFFILVILFHVILLFLVYKFYYVIYSKFVIFYSIILFIISLILVIRCTLIDSYVINKFKKSDIYDKYYVDSNKVDIKFNGKKNNLILIYLESMESSFMSLDNGGVFNKSRIPELESIAYNNISFSNTNKLGGAYNTTLSSFTMASLISSSSGTPIDINLFRGYNNNRTIMKNVRTLGDVLYDNGYSLKVIQGTDIRFAATDIYYKYHKDYDIVDYNTMVEKGYIDKGYVKWWGVEDRKLLDISLKEIEDISKDNKPFAVTIYTMDTHFPDGYLDNEGSKEFDSNLSNVYRNSSKMVSDFIDKLKEYDFYKDTTIVILGDHLSMQNSYFMGYNDYDRRIYNAFINPLVKPINFKNRVFNNYDMYPTILSSIGASIEGNKIGFGTNLFSKEKTLSEVKGIDYFNKESLKRSEYYKKNIL